MKNLLTKLKNKEGFLSLEMIIIVGIVVVLVVVCMGAFGRQSNQMTSSFNSDVNGANTQYGESVSTMKSTINGLPTSSRHGF